jgi:hypothetical protein
MYAPLSPQAKYFPKVLNRRMMYDIQSKRIVGES